MNSFKYIFFTIIPFTVFGQKPAEKILAKQLDSMIILGKEYINSNDFKNAHGIFLNVDSLIIKNYGNTSQKYLEVYYYLARSANKLQDSEEAIIQYKKTIELSKFYNDTLSENYEISLDELSKLFANHGRFKEAELLMLDLFKLRNLKYGKLHPKSAMSIYSLSILNAKIENYELATSYGIECLNIREAVFGKNSMEYASTVYHLVKLYNVQNHFDSAIHYLYENLQILRALKKTTTSIYADCIAELAFLMKDRFADFEQAEALFQESYEVYQNEPKLKARPSYALLLKGLGIHYKSIGNFNKALLYLYEAKSATKSSIGTKNWDYYSVLYNIGNVYLEQKNFSAAKEMYMFILNSDELTAEDKEINFPYVKGALISLGDMTGENVPESYAKDIMTKARSSEATNYTLAMTLNQNSVWLYNHHRYAEALESDREALNIANGVYSPESDLLNGIYFNLCSDYLKINQPDSARKYFFLSYNATKKKLLNSFKFMADSEVDLLTQKMLHYNSILIGKKEFNSKSYAGLLYDDALLYRGILQYSRYIKNKLINCDTNAHKLFEKYKSSKRLLANEYSKPLSEQKRISDLEETANFCERQLNSHVQGIEKLLDLVSWKQVHSQLKSGEAAIEFIRLNIGEDSPLLDSFWYAALLIRPEFPNPEFILMCEEQKLRAIISDDPKKRMDYVSKLYVPESIEENNSKSLEHFIWKPLEPFLNQVKTIYYSPVGLLHRLNLGPIVQSKSKHLLMNDYQFILMSSTRNLVSDPIFKDSISNDCVFIGGIEYELDIDTNKLIASHDQATNQEFMTRGSHSFYTVDSTFRANKWNILPGARFEIDKIQEITSKNNIKTSSVYGKLASEEFFKSLGRSTERMASPGIIHISTHGFFFPDPITSNKIKKGSIENEPVFMNSPDPMIRSGLIMAGANYAWIKARPLHHSADDGILTSFEISQMDLSNTKLVVLSACETGLGDIGTTEGVYGLQRAFKIAGVQNILMSLWQVPDKQTSELMELFYKNLIHHKMTIRASLIAAQQSLHNKGLEPYYWAGFVLME